MTVRFKYKVFFTVIKMNDLQGQYTALETNIINAQEKVRNINPNHPLLDLVTVGETVTVWNEDFSKQYKGMPTCDCLEHYVADLQEIVSH